MAAGSPHRAERGTAIELEGRDVAQLVLADVGRAEHPLQESMSATAVSTTAATPSIRCADRPRLRLPAVHRPQPPRLPRLRRPGCFSNDEGLSGTIFRRTRCRENICGDQGRGLPLSNALMWAGNPGGATAAIEDSQYYASCNNNLVWPASSFSQVDLSEVDFAMRAPIVNSFCWE